MSYKAEGFTNFFNSFLSSSRKCPWLQQSSPIPPSTPTKWSFLPRSCLARQTSMSERRIPWPQPRASLCLRATRWPVVGPRRWTARGCMRRKVPWQAPKQHTPGPCLMRRRRFLLDQTIGLQRLPMRSSRQVRRRLLAPMKRLLPICWRKRVLPRRPVGLPPRLHPQLPVQPGLQLLASQQPARRLPLGPGSSPLHFRGWRLPLLLRPTHRAVLRAVAPAVTRAA